MPLPKVLPAEDAAICQPLPVSTFSHPVLSREGAQTTRASHECTMGPSAAERALERMKRQPPPAPMPAMKIREIKARVIPRETHGGDADFEESQLVAHALPDVYCRGFTGVVGGFGSYAFHLHGTNAGLVAPYVGVVGGGGGPVIPARVVQHLPRDNFDLQGQALKIMERAKILEQKNRFQEYQAAAIAAAVAYEAGVAASAQAVGPTKRKNGSGGSSNSSDSGSGAAAASAAGPARRGRSDGGGQGSDGDNSEQSSLGVGSDISALSLGSGGSASAASSGSTGSAPKKARVDKKGAAAATAAEPGVKRRRTKIPLSSVELLQDWFTAHVAHPYPTEEEKLDIMERAKLDTTQLVNWFTNTRKRFWYQHPTDRSLNRLCATRVSEGGAGPGLPPSCKSTGAGVNKKSTSKRRSGRVKLEDESEQEETDDDDSEAVAAASSPKTSSSRSHNKKRSAGDGME